MGFEHQRLFQKLTTMPHVVGVLAWNQQGKGSYGNHILWNFGFNFWNELNFRITGKLLLDPEKDIASLVSEFLDHYAFDAEQKRVLQRIIFESRSLIRDGWYIRALSDMGTGSELYHASPLAWIE